MADKHIEDKHNEDKHTKTNAPHHCADNGFESFLLLLRFLGRITVVLSGATATPRGWRRSDVNILCVGLASREIPWPWYTATTKKMILCVFLCAFGSFDCWLSTHVTCSMASVCLGLCMLAGLTHTHRETDDDRLTVAASSKYQHRCDSSEAYHERTHCHIEIACKRTINPWLTKPLLRNCKNNIFFEMTTDEQPYN